MILKKRSKKGTWTPIIPMLLIGAIIIIAIIACIIIK